VAVSTGLGGVAVSTGLGCVAGTIHSIVAHTIVVYIMGPDGELYP
jgi:hypothetical protein